MFLTPCCSPTCCEGSLLLPSELYVNTPHSKSCEHAGQMLLHMSGDWGLLRSSPELQLALKTVYKLDTGLMRLDDLLS